MFLVQNRDKQAVLLASRYKNRPSTLHTFKHKSRKNFKKLLKFFQIFLPIFRELILN